MYKDLLEYIIKNLVNYPEDVEISQENLEQKIVLKLKVNKEDMGRVIGKEGRIIRSVREIIYAYSMKNHEKVSVEIEEKKVND